MSKRPHTLINPHNGMLAFRALRLSECESMENIQRFNYYSIVLITEGKGHLHSDKGYHTFTKHAVLYFSLYQPFALHLENCEGYLLNFHPDFFCIYKHQRETACDGVLFNNIYQPSLHQADENTILKLATIMRDMREELKQDALAQHELLVSLLKIFLITAARSKISVRSNEELPDELSAQPAMLQKLKDAIELNFREMHGASQYADLMNISPKALAKLVKGYYNRTLTDMIADRIIVEAKRELYLTDKPVKAIAGDLGFADEYHFSRFFKNKADVSPALYRNQVKFAKAG